MRRSRWGASVLGMPSLRCIAPVIPLVAMSLLGCGRAQDAAPQGGAADSRDRRVAPRNVAPPPDELAPARKAYELRDWLEALRLFSAAGEAGNADAQYYTGLMYGNGQGVERDYAEAAAWYEKAAAQNHPDAMIALARLNLFGLGVESDADRAVELFDRAAQTYPPGQARDDAAQQRDALRAVLDSQRNPGGGG